MAAKPSQTAAWADDANYTGGAEAGTPTKVEPTSGRKSEGWEPGQELPAQGLNFWKNLVGQWTTYLDEGELEGDHVIDGSLEVTGAMTAGAGATVTAGPIALRGIVTPASNLANGNNNNYNPTGLASACVLRLTADAGAFLTGLAGGASGRVVTIFNVGTEDLTVTHEDASSTDVNRILLANSVASVVVRNNGTMTLWYDATSSRWRVFSQNL